MNFLILDRFAIACLPLLGAFVIGCGGGTQSSDDGALLPKANAPTVSDQAAESAAAPAAPTAPPGLLELPKDVDAQALQAAAEAEPAEKSGPSSGGIALPDDAPVPKEAPVIAQRPVLDESPSSNSQTNQVSLTNATLEKIQAEIAKVSKSDGGKVCVVDFWSLSCEPCLKEFPGLVKLQQELGDQVVCMSVNCDFDGRKSKPAETYRARASAFLAQSGAQFPNFLSETANEDVYSQLKIVSIPAVLVYRADGTLERTFTDAGDDVGFSYEKDIAPLVRSMVK